MEVIIYDKSNIYFMGSAISFSEQILEWLANYIMDYFQVQINMYSMLFYFIYTITLKLL